MSCAQVLFGETRVVNERRILKKTRVSHVRVVRLMTNKSEVQWRLPRMAQHVQTAWKKGDKIRTPLTQSPPSIFLEVYIPIAATMLGFTRRKRGSKSVTSVKNLLSVLVWMS